MAMNNDSGRDIALLRNPATGAFDSFNWDSTNNPTFDDSDSHTVLSCLVETEYWANPLRGSQLPKISLDKTGTDTDLVAAAQDALAPAIKAGEIGSVVSVNAQRKRPGTYVLTVNYKNRAGHIQNVRLPIGS